MILYTKWAFSGTSSPNGETYTIDGVKVTYYNDVRWKFVVTESVNNSANTSTYTVKKYAVFYWTWPDSGGSINISSRSRMPLDGSYQTNTASVSANSSSSDYTLIGTDTFTINHNDDGEGKTSFNGNGYYTGGSGTTYSKSVTDSSITMTTIPRVSSITNNSTSSSRKDIGTSVSFTITRASTSFTHTLNYIVGGVTTTIGTDITTSKSYTFPLDLISSFPNTANPNITVKCITYNGSTKIGESTTIVYLSVPSSYVPTCSLAIADVGVVPSEWNIWLKGKSKLQGTITAEGTEGSTITNYLSNANGNVFNTNPFTTEYLKYNGERTITTTVTDSRGRTATDSESIEVIDYFSPTIVMCKVERCLSNGTLDEEGTYGKATIQFKISPVNDGTSDLNSKTIKIVYGSTEIQETADTYEDTVVFSTLLEGLETNASYNFIFSVIDSFEEVPQPYQLSPSFTTYSLLNGGKGVTFGQVANEEGLISHMNTKLYKNNWFKNASIDGLKTEKYDDGNWIVYAEDEE